jgi:bifunctional DNase/RNase
VQNGGSVVHIDARPSDSIAIALRLGAPIFAAESLLVDPGEDEETDEDDEPAPDFSDPLAVESEEESGEALSDAELTAEQLKRYLETLRPEDFGKFNP